MATESNHPPLLLTPGPTQIPDRIFAAMARGTLHHRTPEFEAEFREALQNLKDFTECDELPILLASSGTGGMEATLLNLVRPGETVLVVRAGVFGERWSKIAKKLNYTVAELTAEPGKSFSEDELRKFISQHSGAKALTVQYTETSTTVNHPVPLLGKLLQEISPKTLYIVDAVSALGTLPISIKRDRIDALACGSQKALCLPPGLSMLMMSSRAWDEIRKGYCPSFYFDLLSERKAHDQGTSAWTPAMNIILGLNESFRMLREEGYDKAFLRHARFSTLTRKALKDLGFTLITDSHPSPAVTGAFPPSGIDSEKLRAVLQKKYNVQVAGGQDSLKGKIIRLGHMGHLTEDFLVAALTAVELSLHELQS